MKFPADRGVLFEEIARQKLETTERRTLAAQEETLGRLLSRVSQDPQNAELHISVARCYKQLGRLDEALEALRYGLARCGSSAELHEYYIERLEKCNRTEEAILAARNASSLFPDKLIFPLREALLLPVFYDSVSQIDHYRNRFAEGLLRITKEFSLDTEVSRQRALEAIGKNVNKYLPYQGRNDRDLQKLYGDWVYRIMTESFPGFKPTLPMPPVDGKIRVGYLTAMSGRFLETSSAKLFGGWIREQDRDEFEIHAYHADQVADPTSDSVMRWNQSFRQVSGSVERIAESIRADQLHVLVYLDFGIHPRMAQLSALRLAPVQCVAWDTPLTSGIPTMDYFLSCELMEQANALSHYTEELVRLPGIGVCFQKPVIPRAILTKKRSDFRLREDAIVYSSCQSIFKYSPVQDHLVAQIAKREPTAQIVFLVTNEVVARDFRERIDRAFSAVGLRSSDHCILVPEMDVLDFWNLYLLADVSLDTLGWSGGVTTLEAMACGLPVVTLPGELMRSRHASGILTQLNVTETIARDQDEYVDIAVKLGRDQEFRGTVIQKIVNGYTKLYWDTRSVRALEEFYRQAVR